MNYWMARLSDGTEYEERNFPSKESPWGQLIRILKGKPGVEILDVSLVVNGKTYRLPSNDEKSPFFRGKKVDGYLVARRITQELIFSSDASYSLVGIWKDNERAYGIAIDTFTNDVVLTCEPASNYKIL